VADIALPKRLLAAAEAVQALGRGGTSYTLRDLASQLTSREGDTLAVVAAIDAALSDGATQEADPDQSATDAPQPAPVEPSPTWYAYRAADAALEVLHGRCHQALRLLRHIQTAGDLEAAQEWTRQAIEVLDAPHVGRAEPLRCGHHAPWPSDSSKGCILPPGHTGWHQGIDDCGWSWPVPAGPPTALQEELAELIAALLDSHPDQADTQEEL